MNGIDQRLLDELMQDMFGEDHVCDECEHTLHGEG